MDRYGREHGERAGPLATLVKQKKTGESRFCPSRVRPSLAGGGAVLHERHDRKPQGAGAGEFALMQLTA